MQFAHDIKGQEWEIEVFNADMENGTKLQTQISRNTFGLPIILCGEIVIRPIKIPHTGDTNSLDRCG